MKRLFLCFCLMILGGLFPLNLAHADAATADSLHTISVQGNASYSVAPDRASIAIGITNYAVTAKEAQAQNAAIATAVQNKLKELGITANNIQTRNYTFYPVYNNDSKHSNEIKGYTADNTVCITVDDTSKIGILIDDALEAGANKVNSVDFSLKNPQDLEQKALSAAVNNAREKADLLAAAAGKQVINVLSISETQAHIQSRSFENFAVAKLDTPRTPIEAGDINMQASVQIEFVMN